MSTTLTTQIRRRLGVRAFRDRELEHEFQHAFRFAGVRFLEIGTAVTGAAYLALFFLNAFTKGTVTDQPQPLRLVIVTVLFAVAIASHFRKSFVTRHYELICAGAIATS